MFESICYPRFIQNHCPPPRWSTKSLLRKKEQQPSNNKSEKTLTIDSAILSILTSHCQSCIFRCSHKTKTQLPHLLYKPRSPCVNRQIQCLYSQRCRLLSDGLENVTPHQSSYFDTILNKYFR